MNNNKNKKKLKRRFVTLIEMMIVMFLIALITGVVAYNYSGSLETGKIFKTKAGMEKLQTILNLAIAENPNYNVEQQWREIVKTSPLVHDPDALMKDGWGFEYDVRLDPDTHQVIVFSEKYYNHAQGMKK